MRAVRNACGCSGVKICHMKFREIVSTYALSLDVKPKAKVAKLACGCSAVHSFEGKQKKYQRNNKINNSKQRRNK